MRIALIFGGRSVEHEVSVTSARTVDQGLRAAGHEVVPLAVGRRGHWHAPEVSRRVLDDRQAAVQESDGAVAPTLGHLVEARADVAFPLIHGTWGEDGTLQGLLEMADLPYVGAGVTTSAVAMDKLQAKRVLAAAGLPVVEWATVTRRDLDERGEEALAAARELGMPLFVKPSVGGSSVGAHRLADPSCLESTVREALRFDDVALVERAVEGRELECAVLGYRRLSASAVGEIVPAGEFYDYADKYLDDAAELHAPAEIPEETGRALRRMAVEAFAALGGWGMARVDFFLTPEGGLLINEINTLPGFTAISMYPRLWAVSGLPLPGLVDRLVTIAVRRHRDRARLDEGIRAWLDELSGRCG